MFDSRSSFSRRTFLVASAAASAALASRTMLALPKGSGSGASGEEIPLNADWQFLGRAAAPSAPVSVTLPHTVTKLSWQEWDAGSWEDVWLYRKSFARPRGSEGGRVFVQFDGAMVTADVSDNGTALPQHKGGYLPFRHEITASLQDQNTVEVKLDGRFQDVPPEGSPKGIGSVDYFVPSGLIRGAKLVVVPATYVSDVFAKPVDVLSPTRRVEIQCTVDATVVEGGRYGLEAVLLDGERSVGHCRMDVPALRAGANDLTLSMTGLENVQLWDSDHPHLYKLVVTLTKSGRDIHVYRTRVGFREARFADDGFYLNGKKMQFFGLDRHELYPYVGMAMPARVMRKDAEILRHELNCNIVRCSHYPQHEAFLDACDELGLMVWEEPPGWQYIGDQTFQDQVVENVHDMIVRDRNHASIVIWGVRVNESRNDPALYDRTYALAKKLDDSRPTSGSMTGFVDWKTKWHEDVFAYDDYHSSANGEAEIRAPLEGIPYMLAETVGQYSYESKGFDNKYRRAAEPEMQMYQAIFHAQAHNHARAYDRMCGVIAWCAFEYGSPSNSYKGVKNPGVSDVFRIPKLGAMFYRAQVSPTVRVVIEPNFYWDFGEAMPKGPGKGRAIFHNCDRLEVFVAGKKVASLEPDREHYSHLLYAPSWIDLEVDGSVKPELMIEGYVGGRKVMTRMFSSDRDHDQFVAVVDDAEIEGDGIDATRVTFRVVDKYGAPRLLAEGEVTTNVQGPGELVGDATFSLTESGGAGAVWIRSRAGGSGAVQVKLSHSVLGTRDVSIGVRRA